MIRRTLPDGDLLITQHAHAQQAGRFAALLRDPPEPRAAFLRAVSLHDSGWPMFDDEPEPLPDGRAPHLFDFPLGMSMPAWRRSVAIARGVGATEALLVSRHFSALSRAFAREQEPYWPAWRGAMARPDEDRAVSLLAFCDAVSLWLLCDGRTAPALEPWPFAVDVVEDAVVGRLLPRRTWAGVDEFRAAYAAAGPHRFEVRLEARQA